MHDQGAPLSRRSVWAAQVAAVAGLVAFMLIVRLLAPVLQGGGRQASVSLGFVLAIIPALVWLIVFYVQDAREPEPLGYVLRVAIAGGILGGAVAIPAVREIYGVAGWLFAGPLVTLLGGILVIGAIQEFCNFAAVRYTVFEDDEFDEVADGVTYGTAAGLGLATMLNVWLVLESPGADVTFVTLRIVVTAMAHASFGGIVGYGLGQAKMTGRASAALLGYLAAAGLNGLFQFLLGAVTQPGLTYRPWYGLGLATALAAVVTAVLFSLVRPRGEAAAQP